MLRLLNSQYHFFFSCFIENFSNEQCVVHYVLLSIVIYRGELLAFHTLSSLHKSNCLNVHVNQLELSHSSIIYDKSSYNHLIEIMIS